MVKDNPKTQPKKTTPAGQGKKARSAIQDVVAREYTIHLHKRVCTLILNTVPGRGGKKRPKISFVKSAPNGLDACFAQQSRLPPPQITHRASDFKSQA